MSAYRGKLGKGARARHKADLRAQAEERAARAQARKVVEAYAERREQERAG